MMVRGVSLFQTVQHPSCKWWTCPLSVPPNWRGCGSAKSNYGVSGSSGTSRIALLRSGAWWSDAAARTVGYAYYVIVGHLGVISSLVVSPDCSTGATGLLLRETVDEIRRMGVTRIESPFVSIDGPWLPPLFEREGFHTYWREFLRCERRRAQQPVSPPALVQLEPLRGSDLREAAAIMLAAYNGGVDAQIDQHYRNYEGCELVLQNLVSQGGGGIAILEASAIARQRGRSIGFIILTEIAARQGHLPQVAVLPEYQRQGLGRLLVSYGLSRLAELGFETLSLIVSRLNRPALWMYQLMGFQSVLSFPVFTWEM